MVFNFNRTVNILIRKFYTIRKSLVIFASVFLFIMLFAHIQSIFTSDMLVVNWNMQLLLSWDTLAMIIMAGIFPFLEITNKKNAAFELLYPASRLEKFLVEFLTCFIFLPMLVIIIDILAIYGSSLMVKFYTSNHGLAHHLPNFCKMFNKLSLWRYSDFLISVGMIIISFLGALLFKKYRIVKTWVSVGSIILLLILITILFRHYFYHSMEEFFPYSIITSKHIDNKTGQIISKTVAYYKNQPLDYIPWFFKEVVWTTVGTIMAPSLLAWTWIRYKKERA